MSQDIGKKLVLDCTVFVIELLYKVVCFVWSKF